MRSETSKTHLFTCHRRANKQFDGVATDALVTKTPKVSRFLNFASTTIWVKRGLRSGVLWPRAFVRQDNEFNRVTFINTVCWKFNVV